MKQNLTLAYIDGKLQQINNDLATFTIMRKELVDLLNSQAKATTKDKFLSVISGGLNERDE